MQRLGWVLVFILKMLIVGHKERSFETDMALVFIDDDCISGGG